MSKKHHPVCLCGAYPFPHRLGSGKCPAPYYICSECKQECYMLEKDFGIGSYECHGYRGVHHDYALVSDCCEAEVLDRCVFTF